MPQVQSALEPMLLQTTVGRTPITDLEIAFSARNQREWDVFAEELAVMQLVAIEPPHFERAKQVQRLLAARGLKGRKVPDLLVAATAELSGLEVLHYDADFDHIATVTGQPTRWIVPKGSVD